MVIWASPTGNDANNGSTEALAKTYDGAKAIAGFDDIIILADGTYPLTVNSSHTGQLINVRAKNPRQAIFTGNFLIVVGSNARIQFTDVVFKNASGTLGVSGSVNGTSTSTLIFENCEWDQASYSNGRVLAGSPAAVSFSKCSFKNINTVNSGTAVGAIFNSCNFENIGTIFSGTSNAFEFLGCKFSKVGVIHLDPTSTSQTDLSKFYHCTFNLKDGLGSGQNGVIWRDNNSTGNVPLAARFIGNAVVNVSKMIDLTGAGITVVDSPHVRNNWIQTGTNKTNYTGISDLEGTDPEFYDIDAYDYRLEPTSPLAIGQNGFDFTIGAMELESPETFFDSLENSEVIYGKEFKRLSRTPNGLGEVIDDGTPPSSPASEVVGKMIKGETIILDGVEVTGEYDLDKNNSPATGNKRLDILRQVEDQLYKIRPSEDTKFQSVIRKVNIEVGREQILIEREEMPHAQVYLDDEEYDHHRLAFGGPYPFVTMLLGIRVTAPADYTQLDMANLKDDIEQALIERDFSLNGKAIEVTLQRFRNLPREEESEQEVRQFELELQVVYDRNLT